MTGCRDHRAKPDDLCPVCDEIAEARRQAIAAELHQAEYLGTNLAIVQQSLAKALALNALADAGLRCAEILEFLVRNPETARTTAVREDMRTASEAYQQALARFLNPSR